MLQLFLQLDNKLAQCVHLCNVFVYLLTKSLVHLTPLKTIVISTKDGCPTLLANDGYFGQACTLFYFYSCLFCKFKLRVPIKLLLLLLLLLLKHCMLSTQILKLLQ